MAEKRDISKTFALILIILTVIVSASSTWILISKSMGPDPEPFPGHSIVHLFITRGERPDAPQVDANQGNVKLFISRPNGG